MNYTRSITLDVNATSAVTVVKAKQGDDSLRYINITLLRDGVKIPLESGSSAVFRLEKPDGKAVINSATIESDGTVTVTLTAQCTAVHGKCKADIFIEDVGGKTISTAIFVVDVVKSPDVTNNVASSDEYKLLTDLIQEAEQFIVNNAVVTTNITLPASSWTASGVNYKQTVTISGYSVTANTKVDLTCSDATISLLGAGGVTSLYITNDSGTLTAWSLNGKPTSNVTVQAEITEIKTF